MISSGSFHDLDIQTYRSHKLMWWLKKYSDIDESIFTYDHIADLLGAFLELLAFLVS